MAKKKRATDPARDAVVERIAKEILGLETLDVRGRDQLDFSEQRVGSIRAALNAAYQAGVQSAKS